MRVLYLEDEPMIRQIFEAHFELSDTDFMATSTIPQTRDAIKKFNPDIVLFDWWLFDEKVGMIANARELILEVISENKYIIPVVFTSGDIDDIKMQVPPHVEVISKNDKKTLLAKIDKLCEDTTKTITLLESALEAFG